MPFAERRKFDYKMVHSEVYLNNNNNNHQLDQPVITRITSPPPPFRKLLFLHVFAFSFFIIFPGGQLTPFAPMCGRPCPGQLVLER